MNDQVVVPIEPIQVPAVAWFAALASALILYFALQENGAVLTQNWEVLHEFFHDGRHGIGVPCH